MKPKVEINEKEREIITGEVKRSSCRGNEMLLPVLGLFLSWHLVFPLKNLSNASKIH